MVVPVPKMRSGAGAEEEEVSDGTGAEEEENGEEEAEEEEEPIRGAGVILPLSWPFSYKTIFCCCCCYY